MSAGNFEAQTLVLLARLATAQEKPLEAREFARQAVGMVRQVGMTYIGPTVLAIMATLTEDPTERTKAFKEAEHFLDSGCVAHNHFWFARTAIDHALMIDEWDEAERYARHGLRLIRASNRCPGPTSLSATAGRWPRGVKEADAIMGSARTGFGGGAWTGSARTGFGGGAWMSAR